MPQLSYNEFKSNPLLYILFVPLLVVVGLFLKLNSNYNNQLQDKDKQIDNKDKQIFRMEAKLDKKDSETNKLYEYLGAKRVIDSITK